jgi:hypothetical protein
MLKGEGKKIIMDEYDYGLDLPFRLSGDILATDKIVFTIRKQYEDKVIIRKEYRELKEEDGKLVFVLNFTEEEAQLIPHGKYTYIIQQCRGCELHNTVESEGEFVVKKGNAL